jgi:hypothetical protein
MAQKTLKIKRIYAYAILSNLKAVPPKEYPTTGEIKSTISDILPALKEASTKYLELIESARDLSNKLADKKISEEEMKSGLEVINADWKKYNDIEGKEIVDISLSDEAFKTLQEQFNRDGWGKLWLANIDEFAELITAFEEAAK